MESIKNTEVLTIETCCLCGCGVLVNADSNADKVYQQRFVCNTCGDVVLQVINKFRPQGCK
jgi:hypothetical protein